MSLFSITPIYDSEIRSLQFLPSDQNILVSLTAGCRVQIIINFAEYFVAIHQDLWIHTLSLDLNECNQTPPVCHALSTCYNTDGSFTCECPESYQGDGVSTCLLNNRCDSLPCFLGLKCFKVANESYRCEKCPMFFDGDGTDCVRNHSKSELHIK